VVFDRIDKINEVSSERTFIANQQSRRSTAGLLALLLGGIGVHHFYLGRPIAGIFNLLFCWTFIPALLALVTAIQYFSMTDEKFNRTVDKTHPSYKG
jgi:TM2 domain-containing membrane protein YozV